MSATTAIDIAVVRTLIDTQFPEWSNLPLQQVLPGGWDNRTFRLGERLSVRIPSSTAYATQPEKEYRWLPMLGPNLSLAIPAPVALGSASALVAWPWTVCKRLPRTVASACDLAVAWTLFDAPSREAFRRELAVDGMIFRRSVHALLHRSWPMAGRADR